MNITPAKRLANFPEYIFSRLNKEVAKIEEKPGRKVLNFGAGSPDISPSKQYLDKFSEFIHEPNSYAYPGYGARPEFTEALINWYQKRFDVFLSKDELYPLFGSKDVIALLPWTFLNPGDEVLIPDPGYQGFAGPALMVDAKVLYYTISEEDDYKINIEKLKKLVSNRTKFMWINSPSNPTGQTMSIEELKKIVTFAQAHNIFIVYDNAYSEITFDGYVAPSILQIPGSKEVAVEINSFSKSFSFAGYRIGWIVGNKDIIALLAKTKSQMDSGLSIPLQKLAAYALNNFDQDWHDNMIANYDQRRKIIAGYLHKLGLQFSLPKASLYIWAKIPDSEKDAETYCSRLLHEKQILVTPGTAFGENGKRFVRVSICVNIDNIKEYFNE